MDCCLSWLTRAQKSVNLGLGPEIWRWILPSRSVAVPPWGRRYCWPARASTVRSSPTWFAAVCIAASSDSSQTPVTGMFIGKPN